LIRSNRIPCAVCPWGMLAVRTRPAGAHDCEGGVKYMQWNVQIADSQTHSVQVAVDGSAVTLVVDGVRRCAPASARVGAAPEALH